MIAKFMSSQHRVFNQDDYFNLLQNNFQQVHMKITHTVQRTDKASLTAQWVLGRGCAWLSPILILLSSQRQTVAASMLVGLR